MDADAPKYKFIDETLDKALVAGKAGEYGKVIKLLMHLMKQKNKKKLSPDQEIHINISLSVCYRSFSDFKSALPYAQQGMELIKTQYGPRSLKYAMKVPELCAVYRGLRDIIKIKEIIIEALSILEELGLSEVEEYALMLKELANIQYMHGQFGESLETYERSKPISEKCENQENYMKVLTNIAMCRRKLNQWNKAIDLMKEAIELIGNKCGKNHTLYGIALYNLASIYSDLKRYEDALPLLEEILLSHGGTITVNSEEVGINKFLRATKQNILNSHRESINVGHQYRMCNTCKTVIENMDSCTGCYKVSYCNNECQLKDWLEHKPSCSVCMHCSMVIDRDIKILRCSACKNAKYCNLTCQLAHWKDHKDICKTMKK